MRDPHTAAATVNHVATFGWESLDHVPYSRDLAPSNFHFVPTLKTTLEGCRFTPMKTLKQPYGHLSVPRTPNFTNRDPLSSWSGRQMHQCRWGICWKAADISQFRPHRGASHPCRFLQMSGRENYFSTISRILMNSKRGARKRRRKCHPVPICWHIREVVPKSLPQLALHYMTLHISQFDQLVRTSSKNITL
jgi:hypothetical protein